jgi:outer membrane receptor protein involved in Fe transport
MGASFILACILPISSAPAMAQDSSQEADEHGMLDEIIVTARRRDEALQDSPVAVSALSAEALQQAGVSTSRDLQQNVPGLVFQEMSTKSPSIFIRGIGQKEAAAVFDPSVGVYINGIYIARTDSQVLDTVDPQSIQVLRGPQGTLFGKNNTGGAVLVTTQEPHTDGVEGSVTTRLGNFGRKDAKASINIPLNDDTLSMRAAIASVKRDGYIKEVNSGDWYGDEDRLAATARILWQPTDTFSADIFTYYSKLNEKGSAATCIVQNTGANLMNLSYPPGVNARDRCYYSESLAEDHKVVLDAPSHAQLNNSIFGLTLRWDLDDFEVTSITSVGYQDNVNTSDDNDGTDVPGTSAGTTAFLNILQKSLDNGFGRYEMPDDETRLQYSEEIQFTGSALDESLSYTVGVFAAKEEVKNNVFSQQVGYNGYSYYQAYSQVIPKMIAILSDMTNTTYAAFTQATYDVTDWYQLTLGGRYTYEERTRDALLLGADCQAIIDRGLIPGAISLCGISGTVSLSDPTNFFQNPPDYLPIDIVESFTRADGTVDYAQGGKVKRSKSGNSFTPMMTHSFKIPSHLLADSLDSVLVYFTYSQGYKAGGFDMKGLEMIDFEPEKLVNYELGTKIEAFNNRLRFNTAIFKMDYDDIQVRIAQKGQGIADVLVFVDNAGKATIQGFEAELTAMPFDDLTLSATYNYTDAGYDSFDAPSIDYSQISTPVVIRDRSDEPFVAVPKYSYSIAAMYEIKTTIGAFVPRLSAYRRDRLFTGIDYEAGSPQYRDAAYIDAVTLWGFRFSYTPKIKTSMNFTAFVDNLTDETYFQGGYSQFGAVGDSQYVLGPGRSYGLEAMLQF